MPFRLVMPRDGWHAVIRTVLQRVGMTPSPPPSIIPHLFESSGQREKNIRSIGRMLARSIESRLLEQVLHGAEVKSDWMHGR